MMEGAARVFAGEFSRSTLFVPAGDTGTPGWVVTPGGAWCRQMYLAGVLTETLENGDMLRCRVADPTGAFDIVTGGKNTMIALALRKIPVPSYMAVSGCAQMYQKSKTCILSVRPEQVMAIDRAGRDQLLLTTAEYTIRRLDRLRLASEGSCMDEQLAKTVRHYLVTPAMIRELVQMVEGAVQSVRPQESQEPAGPDVRSAVMELMQNTGGPRGIAVEEIIETLNPRGIRKEDVLAALESLIRDDECYQPQKGYVRLL